MSNEGHTVVDASCQLPTACCQLGEVREPRWHVLWTLRDAEKFVHDHLTDRGFHTFLPMIDVWSRRRGLRQRVRVPMFPNYLFLQHTMDKASYYEVAKTRRLVKVLGDGWDRLAVVPDSEIEAIQKIHSSNLPARPHVYLPEGDRVRITQGLLAGVEGILVRSKPQKGLLVVSIELLRRAIAVEIDGTVVVPA